MNKPKDIKIVSITTVFNPVMQDFNVIGVGTDNKMYAWEGNDSWVLMALPKSNEN